MNDLNVKVMWDAVKKCDEKYDGHFIYAVKSTGICCRPSCKSRTPLKENISFYLTVSLAIEEGYRPCKRCRPDLIHSNEEEIIASAKYYIENEYRNTITLDNLSRFVGVSKFHLQRMFKKSTGLSPLEYVTNLKMKDALVKLQTTEETITEIAYHLGYKSSAHFSSMIRQYTGSTPTDIRRGVKNEN